MKNLKSLHIIRGLAALYVAMGHAKVVFWVGGRRYLETFDRTTWDFFDYLVFILDLMSSSAQEFVIVFFVLSGFFIKYSFDKNNWTIKDFWLNRIIRIYPPYLASILFSISVFIFIYYYNSYIFSGHLKTEINAVMVGSFKELDILSVLSALIFLPKVTYIASNFSYWSLFHEALFYIIVPFIITRKKFFYIATFVSFLLYYFVFPVQSNNMLIDFTCIYSIYFSIGMILYDYIKNNIDSLYFFSRKLSYLLVLILIGLVILTGLLEVKPFSLLLAALLACFSIVVLLKHPLKQNGIYKSVLKLGDISYTLYVFHLPFYYFLYSVLTSILGTYIFYSRIYWLAIPLVLLFSYLIYILIEKKSLVMIEKIKNKKYEIH